MAIGFKITHNIIPALVAKFPLAIDAAAREAGTLVLQGAIENLIGLVYSHDKEPTPTGALMNSGYLRTFRGDGESVASSLAQASNPDVEFGFQPERPKLGTCQILFGVEYAIYVEMGTVYMAERPYLQPAMEDVRNELGAIVADHLSRAF